MKTIQRLHVVMHLNRKSHVAMIPQAKAIYTGVSGHPALFSTINPQPPVVLAQIQDYEVAQQATRLRTAGTVPVRDNKCEVLVTSLESWRMGVQTVCDANPEQAVAIAAAAAMTVAKTPARFKPVLQVRLGLQSGAVLLEANVSLLRGVRRYGRITLNWQYSADGGKTWTSAPSTPLGKTEITGLTPLTTYSFRVSVTISTTVGEWSQAVTILVH